MRRYSVRRLLHIVILLIMVMFNLPNTASEGARAQQGAVRPRGYMTTPAELVDIAQKAEQGIEPYASAVEDVLDWAEQDWDYELDRNEKCENANRPRWIDNSRGAPILYAKALSYHLTDDEDYAEDVEEIIEKIMSKVETISLEQPRCRLTISWGVPELVGSADLIEEYWHDKHCEGPLSSSYDDTRIGSGNCKSLFQNWLAKNAYYVVSLSGEHRQNNWGASATTAMAYIADYLWDRDDVFLVNLTPELINNGEPLYLTPSEAYARANTIALDRMNGYRVDYTSSETCDSLDGDQQSDEWEPVKSQITERGIIPEEARREQYCNIPVYNDEYQNYPQLHIGHNLQQCELMLRRGDSSCYDNFTMTAQPDFTFVGPEGQIQTTDLKPGRGSLERAINAVIIDAGAEWRHDSALEVAYRYYFNHHRFEGVPLWYPELDRPSNCDQDICFGTLTHGFAPDEVPSLPPVTSPP